MARLTSHTGQRASLCPARFRRALTMLGILAGCLALALSAGCSHSDAPFSGGSTRPTATKSPAPCELGPRSEMFLVLDTMPRPIVNAFVTKLAAQTNDDFKPIVGRDQYFHTTDVVTGPHASFRRFIQGGHFGNTWLILYEQGGVSQRVHAVTYELPDRTAAPLLNAHVDTTVKTMCQTAKDLLSRPDEPQPILEDW